MDLSTQITAEETKLRKLKRALATAKRKDALVPQSGWYLIHIPTLLKYRSIRTTVLKSRNSYAIRLDPKTFVESTPLGERTTAVRLSSFNYIGGTGGNSWTIVYFDRNVGA